MAPAGPAATRPVEATARPVKAKARPVTAKEGAVPVWDRFIRAFHWAVVSLVVLGFLDPRWHRLHRMGGVAVLLLVLARIGWGIGGPNRHGRFAAFVRTPRATLAYLRAIARGRAHRTLGHNPAGAAMILALIGTLLLITVSGLMLETNAYYGLGWVIVLHKAATSFLLVLVGLHVGGVVLASWQHRENLVRAMLSGHKSAQDPALAHPEGERRSPARAIRDLHAAVMGRSDSGDDRKPQPSPG